MRIIISIIIENCIFLGGFSNTDCCDQPRVPAQTNSQGVIVFLPKTKENKTGQKKKRIVQYKQTKKPNGNEYQYNLYLDVFVSMVFEPDFSFFSLHSHNQ